MAGWLHSHGGREGVALPDHPPPTSLPHPLAARPPGACLPCCSQTPCFQLLLPTRHPPFPTISHPTLSWTPHALTTPGACRPWPQAASPEQPHCPLPGSFLRFPSATPYPRVATLPLLTTKFLLRPPSWASVPLAGTFCPWPQAAGPGQPHGPLPGGFLGAPLAAPQLRPAWGHAWTNGAGEGGGEGCRAQRVTDTKFAMSERVGHGGEGGRLGREGGREARKLVLGSALPNQASTNSLGIAFLRCFLFSSQSRPCRMIAFSLYWHPSCLGASR